MDCENWTVDDVSSWLAKEKVSPTAVALFRAQEINGEALLALEEADLVYLGLETLGPRRVLYKKIQKLRGVDVLRQLHERDTAPPPPVLDDHIASDNNGQASSALAAAPPPVSPLQPANGAENHTSSIEKASDSAPIRAEASTPINQHSTADTHATEKSPQPSSAVPSRDSVPGGEEREANSPSKAAPDALAENRCTCFYAHAVLPL